MADDLEPGFELPAAAVALDGNTTDGEVAKLTRSPGKYSTPVTDNARDEYASSPTQLAQTTDSIKTKPLDIHGSEHHFHDVKPFRPLDIYSSSVPPSRSKFGLDQDDKLVWDYAVVFDVPEEDENHIEIPPYENSKWAHPAQGINNKLNSRKTNKNKKSSISTSKKMSAKDMKAHRRSSIDAFRHAISQQEEKHVYRLKDLVGVFFDISAHNGTIISGDDEEESGGGSPVMVGMSAPGSSPNIVQRNNTIVRLNEEDRIWLAKRARIKRMQKQAPAIKHFPGRRFFERIFSEVSEGRDYLDKRRFAIAKAFVVVGLLAEQAGLETYCHWSSCGDQILCKLRAEPPEVRCVLCMCVHVNFVHHPVTYLLVYFG